MIPAFSDSGCLPPGVHPAILDEIVDRFGLASEVRRVQMESIRWMLDLARRAGVRRIILNGSFVTDIIEPNDVDCALLFDPNRLRDAEAFERLDEGLPFLDIKLTEQEEFDDFVERVYATDRDGIAKGMVELVV